MATSLRDIPGASKGRSGRRRQRDAWQGLHDGPRPAILVDPRQALGRTSVGRSRRSGMFDRRRGPRLGLFDTLLVLAVLAVALFLAKGLWSATRVNITTTGLARQDFLTAGEARRLDVKILVSPKGNLESATLSWNGKPLEEAEPIEDAEGELQGFHWKPDRTLQPGLHRLVLTVPRPVLPESRFVWEFVVDPTPPVLSTDELGEQPMDEPVTIAGRIQPEPDTGTIEEGTTLTALGEPVELDEEGRFSLRYDRPPAGPILLAASDAAGHVVKRRVFVPIQRATVRGVHMSAISWRQKDLREAVFELIDQGKINTVELDLKDEGGEVGYHSKNALAKRIGSAKGYYDLETAVKELHDRGVRVIGRVVAFRDPILAQAAWAAGDKDWVVQRPDGSQHGAYGGFTNMANKAVQQYNLDIAAEGAAAGMDEILWDYIRRPESGPKETIADIVFPGMPSTDRAVKNKVASFLERSHEMLRAKGVFQGASLFGIAATDPVAVGQDVALISRHVDYIAPMVYPSLWVDGYYKVDDPVRHPYDIVNRSLADFRRQSQGTGVHITPWLQDFSLDGVIYTKHEVRSQVRGAQDVEGVEGFLLWSPRVRYHADLLESHDK